MTFTKKLTDPWKRCNTAASVQATQGKYDVLHIWGGMGTSNSWAKALGAYILRKEGAWYKWY